MTRELVITQEIPPLPPRASDAHKGDAGRIVIIGGCDGRTTMVGAVALAANAAFRSGAGLVQVMVPSAIRHSAAVLAPCATVRSMPSDANGILDAIGSYRADAIAVGPGLGDSIEPGVLVDLLTRFDGPIVLDADGLNLLATSARFEIPSPRRVVLTPHLGEMRRLLAARDSSFKGTSGQARLGARRDAAAALVDVYGCTVVLKGEHSITTDGERLYTNETGNAGMATAGTGDVLTGVITALIGQRMDPFEASILGTYLHGLAGDFAAEELGRYSMTAMDLVEYLPEALSDYEVVATE